MKNIPKIVLELERKRVQEEFEEHILNKQLYGQPMSRNRRNLDAWIDGKIIIELKESIQRTNEELDGIERTITEHRMKKKAKMITKEVF